MRGGPIPRGAAITAAARLCRPRFPPGDGGGGAGALGFILFVLFVLLALLLANLVGQALKAMGKALGGLRRRGR
jgi:hypothetical protein